MIQETITPERIIETIERFPDYIQRQFLIDRMDIYLGHGFLPDENGGFKVVYIDNPEEAAELLQFKLEGLRKCKSVSQVFWMINKPDRLQVLHFLKNVYTFEEKEYAGLLRDAWISTEFPHQMPNAKLIDLFQCAYTQYLMTEEENSALGAQPEIITVYRGLQDKRARHKALSWTLDYEVAHWFAMRWAKGKQVILTAEINKRDVYMYTNERNEEEIVVNPKKLKKVREVGVL
jgi:hypothetical protein